MGSAYFEFFVEYLTSNWSVKFNAFLFLQVCAVYTRRLREKLECYDCCYALLTK